MTQNDAPMTPASGARKFSMLVITILPFAGLIAALPFTVHASAPGASTPRQSRTNTFSSHSAPIVVGSVWPGWTRVSGGSFIRTSMIE